MVLFWRCGFKVIFFCTLLTIAILTARNIGSCEEEWIATLSTVNEEDITYIDAVEEGKVLSKELRKQVKIMSWEEI